MPSDDVAAFHQRLAPIVARIGRGAREREIHRTPVDEELHALLGAGLGRARIPASLGGLGLSLAEFAEVVLSVARADSNVSQILRAHANFVELAVHAAETGGPAAARLARRLIDDVVAGRFLGPGATERGVAFSDDTRLQSVQPDGTLVLDGEKHYSTGAAFATWLIVWLRQDGRTFEAAVPRDDPGVELVADWDGFGQRLTSTDTLVFDRVVVPPEHVLPHDDEPFALFRAAYFQFFHTLTQTGILLRLVDEALAYRRRRGRGGVAPGGHRDPDEVHVVQAVGELFAAATVAQAHNRQTAALFDRFLSLPAGAEDRAAPAQRIFQEVASGQIVLTRLLNETTWRFFAVGGGDAIRSEHAFDRLWRNARAVSSHNPPELRALHLGEELLGARPADDLAASTSAQVANSTEDAP